MSHPEAIIMLLAEIKWWHVEAEKMFERKQVCLRQILQMRIQTNYVSNVLKDFVKDNHTVIHERSTEIYWKPPMILYSEQ